MTQQRDGPSSASVERARAEASRGRAKAERVHPSESEARGVSIPRVASGFVRRVGRLLHGN